MNPIRIIFFILATSSGTLAQNGASPRSSSPIQVLPVKGNVYLIAGAGGNITMQVGDEAVVLVDSGLPQYSNEILAAIRKISQKPVGYIINTTVDQEHTGGNENWPREASSC